MHISPVIFATLIIWLVLVSAGLIVMWYSLLRQKRTRVPKTTLVNDITLDDIAQHVQALATTLQTSVQHIGLVRFSAFQDVGGELSYAIALLDGNGDGVVISNLHSRSGSRTYAKPIKGGKSLNHEVSSEEERAIKQALAKTTA